MPRQSSKIPRVCEGCGITFLVWPCHLRRKPGHCRFCSHACRRKTEYPFTAKFWSCVNKTEGCWLWTGPTRRNGRGYLTYSRKKFNVYRLAWELLRGPIPEDLFVCHNCPGGDNHLCVRPDHMFLGTHQENMEDGVQKGSFLKGISHHKAKLTEEQVREIRLRYDAREGSMDTLANEYGITKSTCARIIHGIYWAHIKPPFSKRAKERSASK